MRTPKVSGYKKNWENEGLMPPRVGLRRSPSGRPTAVRWRDDELDDFLLAAR